MLNSSASTDRLLMVTLSNIGDLVMTTPILAALHEKYPHAQIDIVADRRSGELLRACPYVGEIIWKTKQSGWREKWRLLRKVRARKYLLTVDLRGPWLAWFSRSAFRARKAAYKTEMHAVEHHFTAISAIVSAHEIPWACLWLPESAELKARQLLAEAVGQRILALAPGANWPGKIWPAQKYAALIERVADKFDLVCLLGGKDDVSRCEEIAKEAALDCVDLSGRTSLLESAACLAQASYFVGNDSGIGHLAAALKIPSCTVFGPGEPERYRPWGPSAEIILAPDRDLDKLDADAVAAQVLEYFNGS